MPKQMTSRVKSAQQGAVLMEALIAILIFSVGVLGIVGMQASMVKNTADSKFRGDAAYFAQQRIGELWADPANRPPVGTTNSTIPELPGGTLTIERAGDQYTITVRWQQPGEPAHNFVTVASIT